VGVATFEGVVEHGQIRLKTDIQLPDKTKVYIVVPDLVEPALKPMTHVFSPRLVHPEQAREFEMQVEVAADANV